MIDNGNYLGASDAGEIRSGNERSTLVLGPSRSGKTSSLVLPNLLMTARSVVTTSTKSDVLETIAHARRDVPQLLFDPSGTVRVPPGVHHVGFNPLRAAKKWDHAVLVARSLTDVAGRSQNAQRDHWSERAGALLAPLLHAGALEGISLAGFAARVDARKGFDALELLRDRHVDNHPAVTLLEGILATDERERSGIWSSASGLLEGLRTLGAREAATRPLLDLDAFFERRAQLHVVAASRYQASSVPMVVGLIDEIVHATYDRPDAHTLLALDELANVAPLPQLASIVSEGGGQGVLTLACLQDLSQARVRWGHEADGFLSLFPTAVVLPGIADRTTLELLAGLAGHEQYARASVQRSRRGALRGVSWSSELRPRAELSDVANGRAGHALGVDPNKNLRWIPLTPAHQDERFARYLDREGPSRTRSR